MLAVAAVVVVPCRCYSSLPLPFSAENSHFDYTARYGQCYRLYRKQPQPEQIHLSAAADFPASISPSAQIISAWKTHTAHTEGFFSETTSIRRRSSCTRRCGGQSRASNEFLGRQGILRPLFGSQNYFVEDSFPRNKKNKSKILLMPLKEVNLYSFT